MKVISNSVEETINIGKEFAKKLKGGAVVLLDGDLGAGKTHFSKGVGLGLGVNDVITSPTFTIHNLYNGTCYVLNHFDFYRIEEEEEAQQLGLDEIFYDKNAISIVEWWQNVKGLLPANTIKVAIVKMGENQREIIINE
ncbi:MAG: tRNA (adenosine(37)-N6)-threonylcarbamoyltransferase complex ATPase subunit type 1 TsaE [Clostridia bacterium]|nr:tRNA (adenosine(37)-N6)-threonylcarbamoyltransferase complex ATPase subunit type 1 TsaE [Clostridia bacterium]